MRSRCISVISIFAVSATILMPVATLAMPSIEFGNSAIASRRNLTSSAGERSPKPTKDIRGIAVPAESITVEKPEELPEQEPELEIYPGIFPLEPITLIDDGDAGFAQSGDWTVFPLAGFQGDFRFSRSALAQACPAFGDKPCPPPPAEFSEAHWTFKYLRPGKYDVFATWEPYAELASDASYSITLDGLDFETISVNQKKKPKGPKFEDAKWQKLGTFKVSDGLRVTLNNEANGYVAADAVRIVPKNIDPSPPTFRSACWECHGDDFGVCEVNTNECLTSKEWRMKAEQSCEGHCDEETNKCGVNSFSVNDPCIDFGCAQDGETVYYSSEFGPTMCCSKNAGIKPSAFAEGEMCVAPTDGSKGTCVDNWWRTCGDGECKEGEDFCNCPKDCKQPYECIPEGESTGAFPDAPECCAGLVKISPAAVNEPGSECIFAVGSVICSACGNGICEEWENECNCEEDCATSQQCVQAGGTTPVIPDAPECCGGLEKISVAVHIEGADDGPMQTEDRCMAIDGSMVCSACGNGTCEEWENECNCKEDCIESTPVCGNGICEEGEGPFCPPCDPDTGICSCSIGTCPQDCGSGTECTDSDGGKNYYEKGVTSGLLDGEMGTRTDHCGGVDSELLEEFYCEGNNIAYVHAYNCPIGCEDGACVREEEVFSCPLPGDSQLDIATDGEYLYLVAWDESSQYIFQMDKQCDVVEVHDSPGHLFGLSYGNGSFWSSRGSSGPNGELVQLTSDFEIVRTFDLPYGAPQGTAFSQEKVWTVHNRATDEVTVTNIHSGKTKLAFYAPANAPYGMAADNKLIWMGANGNIYALNKQSGEVIHVIASPTVGGYISGLTLDDDYIWAVDNDDDRLYRIPRPNLKPKPKCGDGICTEEEKNIVCIDPPYPCDDECFRNGNWGCRMVCREDCQAPKPECGNNICEEGEDEEICTGWTQSIPGSCIGYEMRCSEDCEIQPEPIEPEQLEPENLTGAEKRPFLNRIFRRGSR